MVDRSARGPYDARTMGRTVVGLPPAEQWAFDQTKAEVVLNPGQPVFSKGKYENTFEDVPFHYDEDADGRFVRPGEYTLLKWARALQLRKLQRRIAVSEKLFGRQDIHELVGVGKQSESEIKANHSALKHVGNAILGRPLPHESFDAAAREHVQTWPETSSAADRCERCVDDLQRSFKVAKYLSAVQKIFNNKIMATKRFVERARDGHNATLASVFELCDLPENEINALYDLSFFGLINAAHVFVNRHWLSDVFEIVTFMGRANLGVLSIGGDQARLFLLLIKGEGAADGKVQHLQAKLDFIEAAVQTFGLGPYVDELAGFCRDAVTLAPAAPLIVEKRLWPMR